MAAVVGASLARERRLQAAAVVTFAAAQVFDQLYVVVDALPGGAADRRRG